MHYAVHERIETVRLGKIDTLKLDHLELTELPDEVYSLTNLKVLSVTNPLLISNQESIDLMRENPTDDSVEFITLLEELEKELQNDLLVPKQLAIVDERIGQLRSLEVLDLSFNRIEHIPDSIGKLPKLRRLVLQGNQLTSLPDSLNNLATLELLDIRDNPIQYVPALPQLEKYKVYSEHYRLQRNEAFRHLKDVELGVWLYKKEIEYGLVQ